MEKHEYLEQDIKSLVARLDRYEETTKAIYEMSVNIKNLTEQVKVMNERFDKHVQRLYTKNEELSLRIHELEKKPAKKWESLTAQVLGILVAAVIGFVLANVGIK